MDMSESAKHDDACAVDKRVRSLTQELEKARALFGTVFESGPFPMWISDDKGICLKLNEALRQTWGVVDEDVIGKYNMFDDPAVEAQGFLPLIKSVFEEGRSVRFEIEYDAEQFNELTGANRKIKSVIEATISPIKNALGKVTNAIVQQKDLTEWRLAEEAKDKAITRMKQAQKMEAIGLLAAGVAHEINQPLTYIKAIFECTLHDLEQQKVDPKELAEECREAVNQVGRITRIINHLRIFGRAETLSLEYVQLNDVLDNALILMTQMLEINDIDLQRHIQTPLPSILCDANRLEQVFINLFQNSIDALKQVQDRTITISIVAETEQLKLCFTDNGAGVQPALQGRIFDPFVTSKNVGEGTGLGLSIVYGIIKEHQGDIQHRVEAQGSTFVITLPISQSPS